MSTKKIFKTEIFITIGIIIMSLFLYMVFRVNGDFQKIIATISFLFVLPILYIRLILKKPLSDFGMKKGDWKKGIFYSGISLFILAGIFFVLFAKFNFVEKYYLPIGAITSFKSFIVREILLIGFFVALYEFFFRGFIMFYFSNKVKLMYYSNLIQVMAFYLFLVSIDAFDWVRAPYIIVAPLAGIIAQKSQSILYSFVFSWLAFLIIDSIYIKIIVQSALTK
jgi:hypothetical protein